MKSYLLGLVGSINLNLIIVNAKFLVWVCGEKGELNGGVEEVGSRDNKLVNISFFEGEVWLGGMEDEPNKEYE